MLTTFTNDFNGHTAKHSWNKRETNVKKNVYKRAFIKQKIKTFANTNRKCYSFSFVLTHWHEPKLVNFNNRLLCCCFEFFDLFICCEQWTNYKPIFCIQRIAPKYVVNFCTLVSSCNIGRRTEPVRKGVYKAAEINWTELTEVGFQLIWVQFIFIAFSPQKKQTNKKRVTAQRTFRSHRPHGLNELSVEADALIIFSGHTHVVRHIWP